MRKNKGKVVEDQIRGSTFILADIAINGSGGSRPTLGEVICGCRESVFEKGRKYDDSDILPDGLLRQKKPTR